MKRVLVLGAGLVSRPGVHYLANLPNVELTVASLYLSDAKAVTQGLTTAKAMALDVRREPELLAQLVAEHDVSVSLLPATEHPRVAELCLRHQRHMTTASYISPRMRELATAAEQAGIIILNECGVDPGLDHMSAMKVFDEAKSHGGQVIAFRSYCGGLPAPEANDNPVGYKFSWAPRGVLVAATNPAKYLENSSVVEKPGDELFSSPERVEVPGAGVFEGYPNRDSLPYIDMYGLSGVETFFRGTLRNQGHCEVFYPWVRLGLMEQSLQSDLKELSYRSLMARLVGSDPEPAAIRAGLSRRLGLPQTHRAITVLDWLGMFDDEPIGLEEGGHVDILARRMASRCAYANGERDMLVMQHEFVIAYPDRRERRTSSLVDFGIPNGDSSMARTVSLPLAIATRMVLDGTIRSRGVMGPTDKDIYNPVLDECESLGIVFRETVETI